MIRHIPVRSLLENEAHIDWLHVYGCKCWALDPKAIRKKGEYRSVEGIFVGYYDNLKAFKIWVPRTRTVIKARDAIFDESNHIERITIHAMDDDDVPNLWAEESIASTSVPISSTNIPPETNDETVQDSKHIGTPTIQVTQPDVVHEENRSHNSSADIQSVTSEELTPPAPKDFERDPWMDPTSQTYRCVKRHHALHVEVTAMAHRLLDLEQIERAFVTLAEDEPPSYKDTMASVNADGWKSACDAEYEILMGYHTWDLVEKPADVNIVGSRWMFRVKCDNLNRINKFKARLVTQGVSQIPGLDFNKTYSPTICFTSIRLILTLACHYNLCL